MIDNKSKDGIIQKTLFAINLRIAVKKSIFEYPEINARLVVLAITVVQFLAFTALLQIMAHLPGIVTNATQSKIAGILVLFCLAVIACSVQVNALVMVVSFLFRKPQREKIYQFLCRGQLRLLLLWPSRWFYKITIQE